MAPLELHIWGPAFGLPSIDPECLATLSYLHYVLPSGSWTLIASNDVAVSADHRLPALHHNGTWTSGYPNIVLYLSQQETGVKSLDDDLTPTQRADTLACESYLSSRGAALLAFALYVSPSAWVEVTRPAYSSLLSFPLTWTVPLKIRAEAIAKTEHLGLDNLAADVEPEKESLSSKTTAPTTATGFLRLPGRPRLSSTLAPEQAAAIRLRNLTEEFYVTLDELRHGEEYFHGRGSPSSVDFLAFAYLRYAYVRTPHRFLLETMDRTAAGRRLRQFVRLMHSQPIGWSQDNIIRLPWTEPTPLGFVGSAARLAEGMVENVPGISAAWRHWRTRDSEYGERPGESTSDLMALGTAVAGLAAMGAVTAFRTLSPFGASIHRWDPPREQKKGLYQFGDIGNMFDDLPL